MIPAFGRFYPRPFPLPFFVARNQRRSYFQKSCRLLVPARRGEKRINQRYLDRQERFSHSASSSPRLSRRNKIDLFVVIAGAIGTWIYIQTSIDWDQEVRNAEESLLIASKLKKNGKHDAVKVLTKHKETELPPPMKRYLKHAMQNCEGTTTPYFENPSLVTVQQSGEFFASKQWYPFTASLLALTYSDEMAIQPGFVWDCRVEILKIPNHVLETYIKERGSMVTKAWGKVPLIQVEEEEPYILFWLAMAPLFPQTFLQKETNIMSGTKTQLISWNPVHDLSSCSGYLCSGKDENNSEFKLEFKFFEDDCRLLKSIKVTSSCLLQPWQVNYGNYGLMNRVLVPRTIQIGKWYDDNTLQFHLEVANHQLSRKIV